jgi:hypothetical protein
VNLLIPFEHFNELPNLPGARLSLLHGLDSEKNRIPVLPVESLKERSSRPDLHPVLPANPTFFAIRNHKPSDLR